MQDSHDLTLYEPLTKRELEILALLAENLSDREIAARLFLSHTTIKWYNREIFQKLGVENRRQAVKRAAALGLLDTDASSGTPEHNLPAPLTPFVGRIGELEALSRWLSDGQSRLLTLLAPGGMGKTRLALALADSALPHFADGVIFAPLAPLTSPDYLVLAIADAVGSPTFADQRTPEQRLTDFLRHKHLLLILDNFEHLLDSAPLVTRILQAAPQLKIVVTSRERVSVSAETVFIVGGMQYPDAASKEDVREYGAVQLFVQSALRAHPQFAAPDAETVQICRLVQGMPLALELAAAWVATLSPAEIAAEIARSADFLQTSMRDSPERLRSIRAVFDASWARLSEGEQRAFAAMSVFRGGCTREAALAVTGADNAALAGLTTKALLWRTAGTGRYDIHELLRQYAQEQLQSSGEAEAVRAAHQAYFAAYTEKWTEALKNDQLNALDHVDADFDNIRLAFERAIAAGTSDALLPFTFVWHYYDISSRWEEGASIMRAAIDALGSEDSLALGMLLSGYAVLHERMWDNPKQNAAAQAGYEMLVRLGAEREMPVAIIEWSGAVDQFDRARGDALRRECYEIAVKYGDEWATAISLYAGSTTAMWDGLLDEAKPGLLQAHAIAVRLKNVWAQTFTFRALADMAVKSGDLDEAQRLFKQGLAAAEKIRFSTGIFDGYFGLAVVAGERGDWRGVKFYQQQLVSLNREAGRDHFLYVSLQNVAEACAELGEGDEARMLLREALNMREKSERSTNITLHIMRIAAMLLMHDGTFGQALMLLDFIAAQPGFARFTPYYANSVESMRRECREPLSPGQRIAIAEAVAAQTLDSALAVLAAAL